MSEENKLSEIFGKPKEGIHSNTIPFLNIATFDTLGTLAIAWGVSRYWKTPFLLTLLIIFAVGELAHLAFGVETRFIKKFKGVKK